MSDHNLDRTGYGVQFRRVRHRLLCLVVFASLTGVWCCLSSGAECAVLWVDANGHGQYRTVQEAVDAASSGDEIRVVQGVYTKPAGDVVVWINKDLVIHGGYAAVGGERNPTRYPVILSGGGIAGRRVLSTHHLTTASELSGFTLAGGTTETGGGANINSSGLMIAECVFQDNTGSGMSASWSRLSLIDCVFANNQAQGGAGMAIGQSTVTATNCRFNNNVAGLAGGGGVYSGGSDLVFAHCLFTENRAVGPDYANGGAMLHRGKGALTFTDCVFSNNLVEAPNGSGHGGAIDIESDGSFTMKNCIFERNIVTGLAPYGGAIEMEGRSTGPLVATFHGCVFTNNAARGSIAAYGGGWFAGGLGIGNSTTCANCRFEGNLATASAPGGTALGGAISSLLWSSMVFTNSVFSKNLAEASHSHNGLASGGGGQWSNSNLVFTDSVFQGNKASGSGAYGGGAFISDDLLPVGEAIFTNCLFDANVAEASGDDHSFASGGGLVHHSDVSDNLTLTNCRFSRNIARAPLAVGGGMVNGGFSSHIVLMNGIFWNNRAEGAIGGWGGGVENELSSPRLTNCSFSNNWASAGAGMANCTPDSDPICGYYTTPTITNAILWNDGDDGEGEIANYQGALPLVTYSNIQGGYSGAGNSDADPLYGYTIRGDLHLRQGSPSIDTGTAQDAPTFDFDGQPRPVDGDGDGIPEYDMGAYEFRP